MLIDVVCCVCVCVYEQCVCAYRQRNALEKFNLGAGIPTRGSCTTNKANEATYLWRLQSRNVDDTGHGHTTWARGGGVPRGLYQRHAHGNKA